MRLWTAAVAPNPRRVAIFILEKGLDIPSTVIDLAKRENFAPEFVAKNPLAKVPVLELDDGSYLAESVAICRYLEELHPEPRLFGGDPRERADIEMWNRRMESELMLPITSCFRHCHPYWKDRIEQVEAFGELSRRNAEEKMVWLDGELAGRDYIAGDKFTVADITAICAFGIGRVARIRIPETLETLTRWYHRISERPSVLTTGPAPKK